MYLYRDDTQTRLSSYCQRRLHWITFKKDGCEVGAADPRYKYSMRVLPDGRVSLRFHNSPFCSLELFNGVYNAEEVTVLYERNDRYSFVLHEPRLLFSFRRHILHVRPLKAIKGSEAVL